MLKKYSGVSRRVQLWMSVFSSLILISWEQVTRSPLTTHKGFPLSIQLLNLSLFCYSAHSCLSTGFTLQILFISYCSCIHCLLSSLWLVWILRPRSFPPALPCMLFSYGFAFPENTLLLLLPPPPSKFQISLAGRQRGAAHQAPAPGSAL